MFVKRRVPSSRLLPARPKDQAPTVDSNVLKVREILGFDRFEAFHENLPEGTPVFKVTQPVRVKTNPNKSGSAFSQMTEYAVFGGYLDTAEGVKALVVYTERENDDGSFDHGLVKITQVRTIV